MNTFLTNHSNLVKGVNCTFLRYLYKQIDWNLRLIGIFGPRGIGKTTLLLQRIKLKHDGSMTVLYLDMNDLWFQRNSLIDTVETFCMDGGTHLFLDNVHCYPSWKEEINRMLDHYPSLHIVYTASNLLRVDFVEKEIKWEMKCYKMHTMSFREYLAYESILDIPAIPLDELLANHAEFVKMINKKINVVTLFRNYLEHGCYPSYWQDPDLFYANLCNSVRETMDIDLPLLRFLYPGGVAKVKRLLMTMAEKAPVPVRPSEMMKEMNFLRSQTHDYVWCLEDCGFIRLPKYRPEMAVNYRKVYMGNTNLLIALFGDKENRRNLGETFFMDQLSAVSTVCMVAVDEYLVEDKYTFMVGDPLGDYERVRNSENSFAAIYGIPKSILNRMPVWVLGFLY